MFQKRPSLPTFVVFTFLLFALSGCNSYFFTTTSLVKQLPEVEFDEQIDTVAFDNHLKTIKALRGNGREVELRVTKYMAVRMRNNLHERKRVMLTTMFVQDSLLCGFASRSDKKPVKPLRLNGITKLKLLH